MNINDFPKPPVFTEEELKKWRDAGDFCHALYEWYKFVDCLCKFFCSIKPDSDALLPVKPIYYAVLIGLLNRCSKLMFSNVVLSRNGSFGETTAIIDRCIFESCVKVVWLCEKDADNRFDQFIADGLKADLILRDKINNNIARNSKILGFEKRMLKSIEDVISSSGLSEEMIKPLSSSFPTLNKMISTKNDLLYTIGQKMGSHHVHGTWTSLLCHYIEAVEPGIYCPKDKCNTSADQYMITSLLVLEALASFVKFVFSTENDISAYTKLFKSTAKEILKINKEIVGNDFELQS